LAAAAAPKKESLFHGGLRVSGTEF